MTFRMSATLCSNAIMALEPSVSILSQPGSSEKGGFSARSAALSFFLNTRRFVLYRQLLLHRRRHLRVVREMDAVGALPAGQ